MRSTHATRRPGLRALIVLSGILAVNGLVLGPIWLATPGLFSDTVASPAYVVSQRVSWAALTALVVLIPVVAAAGRRPLPEWAISLAQIAFALQATLHFVQGFVLPWLLTVARDALDLTDGGLLQTTMLVIQIGYIIAIVTFAVMLWRSGRSKTGAILMVLGALVTPAVGPIGAGVLGIGLALVAVAELRAGRHAVVAATAR